MNEDNSFKPSISDDESNEEQSIAGAMATPKSSLNNNNMLKTNKFTRTYDYYHTTDDSDTNETADLPNYQLKSKHCTNKSSKSKRSSLKQKLSSHSNYSHSSNHPHYHHHQSSQSHNSTIYQNQIYSRQHKYFSLQSNKSKFVKVPPKTKTAENVSSAVTVNELTSNEISRESDFHEAAAALPVTATDEILNKDLHQGILKQSSRDASPTEIPDENSMEEVMPQSPLRTSSLLITCNQSKITLSTDCVNGFRQEQDHVSRSKLFKTNQSSQGFMPHLSIDNKKNSFNNNSFSPSKILSSQQNSTNITLIVDDTRFGVDPEIFKQHPNTMLGRMFSTMLENKPNENGEYSVAYGVSSPIFKAILDFYKHGIIKCPPNVSIKELKEACDYLLIPFDGNTIRSYDLRSLLNE